MRNLGVNTNTEWAVRTVALRNYESVARNMADDELIRTVASMRRRVQRMMGPQNENHPAATALNTAANRNQPVL